MRRSLLSLFVVLVLATVLVAQVTLTLGHLHGIVRDTSGAALPGVTVILTSGARVLGTALSDARGEFAFRDLPPGQYRITATLLGFSTVQWNGRVAEAATSEAPITLAVGGIEETITVTGATPSVDTSTTRARGKGVGLGGGIVGGVTGGIVGGYASSPPAFNTEAYDKIDDNQWTHVSDRPRSTFSTDVDTASYANVRRFINQGQMPPKDAVRIEEMINYFSYEYPEPIGNAPFSISAAVGECPWDAAHRLAHIGLQARHLHGEKAPPRNLVFLVDVSGSMQDPHKLPLVKASLALLARNLTDRDRIALVVYAGAAGVVLPSTSGGDVTTVLDALARLEAGGSTNGAEGITLAYRIARNHFIRGGSNRVVLATDGDFNVGVSNQGDLIRLIEENREQGVTLSILGFGMGNLKDSTMEKLADRGNGNYSYIDTLSEAQKVLVEEASGTLVTVAKDVKLQVEFNPMVVSSYRLIGYENRRLDDRDFNDDKKDAGDMGVGHSVTALYEIELTEAKSSKPDVDPLKYQQPPTAADNASHDEAMTVKVRYKTPDGADSALLSVPVSSRVDTSRTLGFASAVAEFGMLLRDSQFKGSSSYANVLQLAALYQGSDRHGHRAEFKRLVASAEALHGLRPGR